MYNEFCFADIVRRPAVRRQAATNAPVDDREAAAWISSAGPPRRAAWRMVQNWSPVAGEAGRF
jgi:hypothetical protein